MTGTERQRKEFIAYEYKEIRAESSKASFLIDGYENFGWELDGNVVEAAGIKKKSQKPTETVFHLKRNRKIVNKMELTRLQRNFESCVAQIEKLENAKTSLATIYALVVAIVGTAFMAGATFAVTADPPHIVLCILLSIPGFLGWIFPYFIYKKVLEKQTEKMTPLIDEKYDEIFEICEKGNKLLY